MAKRTRKKFTQADFEKREELARDASSNICFPADALQKLRYPAVQKHFDEFEDTALLNAALTRIYDLSNAVLTLFNGDREPTDRPRLVITGTQEATDA